MRASSASSTVFAFRGSELLCGPDGGAEPLASNPFPDRETGRDPRLLDAFPLRIPGSADPAEAGTVPTVLSLAPESEAPDGLAWIPFRSVPGNLAWYEVLPACRALALIHWRAGSRYCGRCGSAQGDKAD